MLMRGQHNPALDNRPVRGSVRNHEVNTLKIKHIAMNITLAVTLASTSGAAFSQSREFSPTSDPGLAVNASLNREFALLDAGLPTTERTRKFLEWKVQNSGEIANVSFGNEYTPVAVEWKGNVALVYGKELTRLTFEGTTGPDLTTMSQPKRDDLNKADKEGAYFQVGEPIESLMLNRTVHRVVLSPRSGWIVVSRHDIEEEGIALSPAVSQALYDSGVQTAAYDYPNAAAYADRWWNRRNPKYASYPNADCANFYSQCAGDSTGGKLPQTATWKPAATAWVNADGLYNFMRGYNCRGHNGGQGYAAANDYQIRYAIRGDLLGYDWKDSSVRVQHVAIPTAYMPNGSVLVNAHTTDVYRWPWDLKVKNANRYFVLLMK